MGKRKKQEKMTALADVPFVLQEQDHTCFLWHQKFLQAPPYILEVGCGHGTYTVELARRNPEQLHIGLDIKGPRLWPGVRTAQEYGMSNVAFLRMPFEHIGSMLPPNSVSDIWITFPDPKPKPCRANQRATSPESLVRYKKVLAPGGKIPLKTDSDLMWQYTLDVIGKLGCNILQKIDNVPSDLSHDNLLSIQTTYEAAHRNDGRVIRYVAYTL